MGTGGEEPLQGAAGITQVRETLYSSTCTFSGSCFWQVLGAGLGWPMEEEEEDVLGISGLMSKKCKCLGNVAP